MEMFYNTDLLLNNNLNRDMILKRFEKSSKSEKTLIRIDEDFNMARILNYILDEENTDIVLNAYKAFSA